MNLRLKDRMKISEVQGEFNRAFPFLMLGFDKQQRSETSFNKIRLGHNSTSLGELRKKQTNEDVKIDEGTTIAELEKLFLELYGLIVHIYRRSGGLWLETTMTSSWTLKQQNELGKELDHISKS